MKNVAKRMERLIKLVSKMKSSEYPNAETFAEELREEDISTGKDVAVSSKTIKRDIAFLRHHLKAPVKYDPINRGYYLEEPWSFPFWEIGIKELFVTLFVCKISEPIIPSVMQNVFHKTVQFWCAVWDTEEKNIHLLNSVILAVEGKVSIDPEILEKVLYAWKNSFVLNITYKSPRKKHQVEENIEIHALFLFENLWYAKAWCRERNEVRNYALHRIKKAQVIKQWFPKKIAIIQQLKSGYNIFGYPEIKNVKIRCNKRIFHGLYEAKKPRKVRGISVY